MAKKKLTMEEYDKLIQEIAQEVGATWDGNGDDRIFLDEVDERTDVYAHLMTEEEYEKMEEDIANFLIKGKGYDVYVWNDASSYDYWRERGEAGDSNYIQVTAAITDPSKIDRDKLKSDLQKAHNKFSKYDNKHEYYNSLDKEGA